MRRAQIHGFVYAVAMGACFCWACRTGFSGPLQVAAVFGACTRAWLERRRWTPSGRFGTANVVTAVRFGLAFSVGALHPAHAVPAAGLLLIAFFALDGVDGWIARRSGDASDFGAAFDVETDAFMTAMGTLTVVKVGLAGPWILVVGGLRYAYVVATAGVDREPEPSRRGGRWAFSALMLGLCASLIYPHRWTELLLHAGAAGVMVSFARSFRWQFLGR